MAQRPGLHAPIVRDAMAYVLAGGRGSRLLELTDMRAKPAVYFGGKSRIIDFALSNALNSGIRRIGVATQYKAHSLIRHLQRGWNFFRPERNEGFDILPASQRSGRQLVCRHRRRAVPEHRHHRRLQSRNISSFWPATTFTRWTTRDADAARRTGSRRHGRLHRGAADGGDRFRRDACGRTADRIIAFVEKPADPPAIPGQPDTALASMGIYVFNTRFLIEQLRRDEADKSSNRDFGKDIIPYLVKHGKAVAHRFTSSCVTSGAEREAYWRDVGTLDAYWEANIDLTAIIPALDLYDRDWPIWTYAEITPPAKFVHEEVGRRGEAISSLVSGGCIVSGSFLRQSLLFTGVHVHSYARVEQAVILPDADIGRGARLRNVIVEKGVKIPPGLVVGEDADRGRAPVSPHRAGDLPDHAADDRPAGHYD